MGNKQKVGAQDPRLAKILKKKSKIKGAPRSKRPGANNGPARQRYWTSGRLEERKVKALMVHCGYTRAEAVLRWLDTRKGRMKQH